MFTTRRSIQASQRTNEWHGAAKLAKLAANACGKFAPDLAEDVVADLHRFASAAEAENLRRQGIGPAPIAGDPPSAAPTVAN